MEISILVKIVKNKDFGENCRKISSKLSKNLNFGQNCQKFSILVNIYQNVDFGHIWRKYWF